MIKDILLVFVGGGLGSVCRYFAGFLLGKIQYFVGDFPIHTFTANALGCLLIGILAGCFSKNPNTAMQFLLVMGFCGGFTTFSTFSLEIINMFKSGQLAFPLIYVAISLILCLLMTILGMCITR